MCGICGTVGFVDKDLLKKMTDALRHRGPDSEGFYTDMDAGLGVRRLRVIDLATGDQPIFNEKRSLCVVHNGEIYNYKELREELRAKGHSFYTQSDTEVIVHLYEEYGRECVRKLDGMFVFAVWDKENRELFIARDRLGIKPLYYHCQDGKFRFASELKSLIQDGSLPRSINPLALASYFNFLYIPSPDSIFAGIHKLPVACTISFRNGEAKVEKYWDLSFANREKTFNEKASIEKIKDLLENSVKKHLVSDVPLGVFLSGGIDSSTVVAMMREVTSGPIKTFSIGYGPKDSSYNELDYSKMVADHFGTEHKTFIVEPDIVKILPKVVWHLDEPFADSSAVLSFLISQEARRAVTVALSGIGGDEVFGGYPRYIGARLSLLYKRLPLFLRKFASGGLTPFIKESVKSDNTGGRIKRFLKGGILDDEERYISWISFSEGTEEEGIFSGDFKSQLMGFDAAKIHRECFRKADADDYLDKIFYVDVNTYLVDDLLHMGDRMSMANSLEVRVPFCDHKLVEYSASIPYERKICDLRLKGLLKESLKGLLPDAVLEKGKQGFMVPVGRWIKEDLKDHIKEVLSEENIRKMPFLNERYVQDILSRHFSGKNNYAHQVWALLVFKLWYDLYVSDK